MDFISNFKHLDFDGEKFYTVILTPNSHDCYPIVIFRSPYVQNTIAKDDDELAKDYLNYYKTWLERGYAVIFQHCRGCGKSSGAFIPYVHEREDTKALFEFARKQPFYCGEIYLCGGSYTASLHYTAAPFDSDIKGAIFEVQDSERYRLWYRNGQMRRGHANWHFGLYKNKCGLNKTHNAESFSQLPISGLSERVLGDRAEDFEQMLCAPSPNADFWGTRHGGGEAKGATDTTNVPILLTTGYNDFYVGGIFKMWEKMSESTKKNCALIVSPYNHGDGINSENSIAFPKGKRCEQFGETYAIDWFDSIRKGISLPYEKGKITYYRAFENKWKSDYFSEPATDVFISLGSDTKSFTYNPLNPPKFGAEGDYQIDFKNRNDVITFYTLPSKKDLFIKGRMKAKLCVSSNCPDTSFYVSISIEKPHGDYVLRHDITSLCYQLGDYTVNSKVTLDFNFDDYAFLLKKGERLRVDISSTDFNTYVCHTNKKGAYHKQTECDIATNTVYFDDSFLILPVEP